MRCVVLLQLAVAVLLLLLPGQPEAAAGGRGRRVVRYRCQYLRTQNHTKIVCSPVEVHQQQPGDSASASMQPEAFNGQRVHRGPACSKLHQLAERLAAFEEGAWKYCDPTSCMREVSLYYCVLQWHSRCGRALTSFSSPTQSPHCTNSVLSTECSQCLGRCWIMYAFPGARVGRHAKDFPCDPLACGGAQVFCGGYKFKDN
ncbi:uncharacterized protein LOC142583011 isoform X1 [Dermacentor variabilis]|uniref:uncharacterized protein LOC142583011 isoform X1 n=1 Tax=Dermacentor variabilis TaxID=34621 RepID=UPI003F5C038B